jgi:hypothetical protein
MLMDEHDCVGSLCLSSHPFGNLPNLLAAETCHMSHVIGLEMSWQYSINLLVIGWITALAKKLAGMYSVCTLHVCWAIGCVVLLVAV